MPTDRPVPPEARKRRSSRRTSRTPAPTRRNARRGPRTPPPPRPTPARRPTWRGRPVEPVEGAVLADGAGHDGVSLGTKLVDRLHGVEAHGTLRSSVVLAVAVCVALEPERGDPCRRHRRLRDAARRDADLYDSSVHPRPPWRASARAPRLYASAATRHRARHPDLTGRCGESCAERGPLAPARRAGSGRDGGR